MKKHLSSLIIATVFAITVCLVSLLTWTPAKAMIRKVPDTD